MTIPATAVDPATPTLRPTTAPAVSDPPAATIAAAVARLLEENPHYRIGGRSADPALVGATVHAVVAILAPVAGTFTAAGLIEVTVGLSRGLCAPGRYHRRNSMHVAGFAAEYLRGAARPRSPWVCTGSEEQTEGGVVDLVWQHPMTGMVFVDELKTTQTPRRVLDTAWITQVNRYAEAGAVLWGGLFAGVRLIPLGSMHLACVISADGRREPLVPTVGNPLAGVA